MKTLKLLKTVIPVILLFTATLFIGSSCGSDPLPEQTDPCNHHGWFHDSVVDNADFLIEDTDLSVQFFPNASNGPFGNPGFEISGTNTDGHTFLFITDIITVGGTGTPLSLTDNGMELPGTITLECLEAGTSLGERVRYNIEGPGYQIEICVIIDQVL